MAKSKTADKTKLVVEALESFNPTSEMGWSELDALATRVYFEGIEADPEGIVIDDDRFTGAVNVYVQLESFPLDLGQRL